MTDLRSRLPAQSLMQRTLELHPPGFFTPSGEALSWYKGALGEIAVAGVLAQLDSTWTVLHSVPVGNRTSDIDHVVIGPAGVFTLNTKSHPGQKVWIGGRGLLISGQKTHYVANAAAEAERAERVLSNVTSLTVPVTAVVVLVNPGKRTVRAAPERGVQVVTDGELLTLFAGRPVFSPEQTQRIVAAAVQPGTWHRHPAASDNGRAVAIQFNAIIARALQGAGPAPLRQPSSASGTSVGVANAARPPRRMGPLATESSRGWRSVVKRGLSLLASFGAIALGIWLFNTVLLQLLQPALQP